MKYTKLSFSYGKITSHQTDSLNTYIKNKMYSFFGDHMILVDTDKVEAGKEKFKKELLKYYNNLITNINEQI